MALVKAVDVIVPAEPLVIVARLPVPRRLDAVQQGSVVQYRQVKAAPVPGNQGRRVFFDSVKEALNQFRFRGFRRAQRPDTDVIAGRQHDRDRRHPVQVQPQEVGGVIRLLAADFEHGLGGVLVGETFKSV